MTDEKRAHQNCKEKQHRRIGSRTIQFSAPVAIKAWATAVGRKENEGKLSGRFDYVFDENRLGEKSWERAEQRLQQTALELALEKAGLSFQHLSYYMGGDLLNQIVATSYTARMTDVPYIGLYGACSSLAEGMIVGGCMLAAWLSAKWLGEKPGQTLDLAGCALPVFMMFERAAERWIPEFDYSRALESEWLGRSFLAIQDGPDANLATWRLAAAFAAGLFIWLFVCAMTNPGRPGDICIRFLLFFGAGSVILESLRYDMFLSISFVGIQEILALVILCAGVIAAVRQAEPGLQRLKTAALVSLPVAGLIGLGLEFALDRTTINKFMIYAVMIAVMFTPAFLGLRLIRRKGIKQA